MDFAVGGDFFEEGVLVDLAVDRDGDTLLQVGFHGGEALAEFAEEVPDRVDLEVEFALAVGETAKRSGEHDPGHLLLRAVGFVDRL